MNYIYTRLRIIIQSKEDLIFAKVQTIKNLKGAFLKQEPRIWIKGNLGFHLLIESRKSMPLSIYSRNLTGHTSTPWATIFLWFSILILDGGEFNQQSRASYFSSWFLSLLKDYALGVKSLWCLCLKHKTLAQGYRKLQAFIDLDL